MTKKVNYFTKKTIVYKKFIIATMDRENSYKAQTMVLATVPMIYEKIFTA